jgi:hypothetical protein
MHARTLVFRTIEDPNVEVGPDDCRLVGANLFLGGRILSLDDDGALGTALACAALTEPLVRDVVVPFAAEFRFDDAGTYAADGTARVIDADVPEAGVVQAACALRLTSGPAGVIGGTATSASVFDPAGTLEAGTGSVWTIRAYFDD